MSAIYPFDDQPAPVWTMARMSAALKRRARLLLTVFAALSAGAITAVLTAPTLHEGGFKLLVKKDRADAVVSGIPGAEMARSEELSENELMSQVELLKAQDIREKVATEAGLTDRLLAAGHARTDQEALAAALDELDGDLSVKPIRKTWLIEVTYRDKDPRVARKVLDTVLQSFFNKHLMLHRPSGSFEFFSEQVTRARQQLDAAQADLLRFTQTAGVVAADAEKQAALQKLAEFEALRMQTQAQLAEATRRETAARDVLAQVPEQRMAQTRTTQNAGAVEQIQSQLLTLEMRRTELLQRFTPEYRGVVELDQQIRNARTALNEALNTRIHEETVADNPTRQWLDTELIRAHTDSAALAARAQSLAAATAGYRSQAQRLEQRSAEQNELLRRLTAAEERYRLYLAKQEEARISDEMDKTRIANVAIAEAPALRPKPLRSPSLAMLPLLLLVALFLSGGLALAMEAFSPAATAEYIDAPALAPHRAGVRPGGPAPADGAAWMNALAPHGAGERGADTAVLGAAQLETMTRRIRRNTAAFCARLEQLKALTDSITARCNPGERRVRETREKPEIGWAPVPSADGIRQSA